MITAGESEPSKAASLTEREHAVCGLVLIGLSDPQIARQLGISYGAVRTHLRHILHKLGIANRASLRFHLRENARSDHFPGTDSQLATMDWLNLAACVLDDFQHGLIVTDEQHRIVRINPAFSRITGYSADELVGQRPSLLQSGHHSPDFYTEMRDQLATRGHWSGDIWNRKKDGEIYLQWLDIRRLNLGSPEDNLFVGLINDITGEHADNGSKRNSALHDNLTGLANRTLLKDRAQQEIARAHRGNGRLGVLFIDLDRFKPINDSLGHAAGDFTLARVAARLKQTLRANDTLARYGGDEFVALVPDLADRASALEVAEKIIDSIKQPIMLDNREYHLGASIGISLYPMDGLIFEQLIDRADNAMYRAKEAGGNTTVFHDAALQNLAADRLLQEAHLRESIEKNQFLLLYQPKIDLSARRIFGAEALLRWHDPTRGIIPPDEFIPLAEQSGLIVPLGTWVLQEACRTVRRLRDAGHHDFCMAVNVSPLQIARRDFIDTVTAAIAAAGIPAQCLQLEITESVFIRDPAGISDILNLLTATGVSLALDDFGTGYSSLSYLKHLPFDTIKIDRQFINEVYADRYNGSIARATMHLADGLDMKVVAEGVENRQQAAWLKDIGCHHAQGWLFGKPMTEAELLKLLTADAEAFAMPDDTEDDRSGVVSWSDIYVLGLPEIDAQHSTLFDLINRLWQAIDRRASAGETMELIEDLERYTLSHFVAEETFMRLTNYPDFNDHKHAHDAFAARVAKEKTAIKTGGMGLSFSLLRFLFDWLSNHILHADKSYARYYNTLGKPASPADEVIAS